MPKMVAPQTIESATTRLRSLPEKPKTPKPVPLAEAIRQMKGEVQAALKRGYTFDEIAQSLQEDGIDIGIATLKSYVYKGKRRTPGVKPRQRATTGPAQERTGSKAVEMPTEL